MTQKEAAQLGLQANDSEIQYSTRADLMLTVPDGLNLDSTMFDFFRWINVIEFKGQNDQLDLEEYIRNELRTDLIFL